MKFNIKTIWPFERELKDLLKKHNSLKKDYELLLDLLEVEPTSGTPLGKNCYKIRLPIKSKAKEKVAGQGL